MLNKTSNQKKWGDIKKLQVLLDNLWVNGSFQTLSSLPYGSSNESGYLRLDPYQSLTGKSSGQLT